MKVTGRESTVECQDNQLCVGLKADIDSAVHGVKTIWEENSTMEDWGFLLLDVNNTSKEVN